MKVLVFRLSSLGDLLLSTSFLENLPSGFQVDWVISSEFEFVLKGHPRIRRLIPFDKKTGFRGWIRLLRSLRDEHYELRVDLHRTLRSTFGLFLFKIWDLSKFRSSRGLQISKERIRTLLYLVFKGLMPGFLRPTPYWRRFGLMALSLSRQPFKDVLPPSYFPLLPGSEEEESNALLRYDLKAGEYYAVMPASRWRSKEWTPFRYLQVIQSLRGRGLIPLILGREKDPACAELLTILKEASIPYRSALAEPDFKVTAMLLKQAKFYLGVDTGLSHLAEALGTRSYVIFGPTRPDLGFGPRLPSSKAISHPIGCAPCSKDGKTCYRITSPYACMKRLSADAVLREL